jgi:hypothetical protein
MLACREHEDWSLKSHDAREYATAEEKRFFESVENPKEPTKELKDLYRDFGKYLQNSR